MKDILFPTKIIFSEGNIHNADVLLKTCDLQIGLSETQIASFSDKTEMKKGLQYIEDAGAAGWGKLPPRYGVLRKRCAYAPYFVNFVAKGLFWLRETVLCGILYPYGR